ncbi:Adenosine deaminase-like protein [Lamellibrachia satsuma]|nr:Adenosine deaminase-like protein [Lamellibrachia satsuma]
MQTIQHLIDERKRRGDISSVGPEQMRIAAKEIRTLDDCFEMFKLIHQLCDNEDAIYKVTSEVIREFAADNVKYLELRSTPRAVPSNGMTKTSYIGTILRAIDECHSTPDLDIVVRLLLSVDRRCPVSDAMDTVNLAAEYMHRTDGIVVGIDLSGDPKKGDIKPLLPVLSSAKEKGLKLTLHLAEIPGQWEECSQLLALLPDRIGHGTYLHMEDARQNDFLLTMEKHRIPLELCLTSNLKSETVCSLDNHHFSYWHEIGHPCVICTDDKGVFATTLSEEYALAAQTFHLSPDQIWSLSFTALDYIFADGDVKERLRKKWVEIKSSLLGSGCEPE